MVSCLALSVESACWVLALCPALHFRSKVRTWLFNAVLPVCFGVERVALPCISGRKCALGIFVLSCLALLVESARWVLALCPALHFRSKVRTWLFSAVLPFCFGVERVALPCISGRKCTLGIFVLSCLALSVESARWVSSFCPALHFRPKVHVGRLRCVLPRTFDRKCTLGACSLSCLALSTESTHFFLEYCPAFLCLRAYCCHALHFWSEVRVG